VLEQICKAGVPLSSLRKPFDRYAASGEINTRVDDAQAVIERVAAAYPDAHQDRLDGLTVDNGDWWFNLRPSNTEPLLRLNLQAATRERCARHVAAGRALIADKGCRHGTRRTAPRVPRLPGGQGAAALLPRRGRALQPPPAP